VGLGSAAQPQAARHLGRFLGGKVDSNLKGSKVLNEKTVKYEIAKAPEIWHVARPKIKYFGKELFSKYLYIEREKKP
jgi:hypothetical protein